MKDAPVREELRIHEYRIWDQYAEATFDREYQSSMEKSPDHLIFLTGLVHTQKLLYLVLSKKFGFEYKSGEKEKLKIWPTQVDVSMPSMIRKNRGVLQRLWVTAIKQLSPTRYEVHLISDFEGVVKIHSTAAVFLI
ncbi:MAG: hypothetical protein EA369_09170 [Bradymonadales bacterium]|nr:MAG: hypothetical protein EA369_09170 [Bradymonadales bacterium]